MHAAAAAAGVGLFERTAQRALALPVLRLGFGLGVVVGAVALRQFVDQVGPVALVQRADQFAPHRLAHVLGIERRPLHLLAFVVDLLAVEIGRQRGVERGQAERIAIDRVVRITVDVWVIYLLWNDGLT